jgi:hypothetical protein
LELLTVEVAGTRGEGFPTLAEEALAEVEESCATVFEDVPRVSSCRSSRSEKDEVEFRPR